MNSYLCYAVSRASVYLPSVFGEHQGKASEPTFHGPGGSRGGFKDVVIPKRCTGFVQLRGAVINHQAQMNQYTLIPAKLIIGLPRRYGRFSSRPLQQSKYCVKESHRIFLVFQGI